MSRYDFTGAAEWNRISGWFNLSKAIAVQQRVKTLPPGAVLVELGSFHGRSSVAIAAVMPEGAVLHCVDHFQGSAEHHQLGLSVSDMQSVLLRNLESFGVRDRVRVHAMGTLEAARLVADASVDFLLLDASHDLESVMADLAAWHPKLKSGGLLFCDDYDPHWPGVMEAVRRFGLPGQLAATALWLHQKL
jgi:predicted O-methyltransferase YrrM